MFSESNQRATGRQHWVRAFDKRSYQKLVWALDHLDSGNLMHRHMVPSCLLAALLVCDQRLAVVVSPFPNNCCCSVSVWICSFSWLCFICFRFMVSTLSPKKVDPNIFSCGLVKPKNLKCTRTKISQHSLAYKGRNTIRSECKAKHYICTRWCNTTYVRHSCR
jgi:hypothetical protein